MDTVCFWCTSNLLHYAGDEVQVYLWYACSKLACAGGMAEVLQAGCSAVLSVSSVHASWDARRD